MRPPFVNMYLNVHNICKPDRETVLDTAFLSSRLCVVNPIEAYLLCKSLKPDDARQQAALCSNALDLQTVITESYPRMARTLFDLVE